MGHPYFYTSFDEASYKDCQRTLSITSQALGVRSMTGQESAPDLDPEWSSIPEWGSPPPLSQGRTSLHSGGHWWETLDSLNCKGLAEQFRTVELTARGLRTNTRTAREPAAATKGRWTFVMKMDCFFFPYTLALWKWADQWGHRAKIYSWFFLGLDNFMATVKCCNLCKLS